MKDIEFSTVCQFLQKEFGVSSGYERCSHVKYLVYEQDNEIIAILCYSILYERAELDYILVLKEYRNQGIALQLMNQMEQELKVNGVVNITLEVEQQNISALTLYEKLGYKKVAERKGYYQGKDGFLMLKELVN